MDIDTKSSHQPRLSRTPPKPSIKATFSPPKSATLVSAPLNIPSTTPPLPKKLLIPNIQQSSNPYDPSCHFCKRHDCHIRTCPETAEYVRWGYVIL
ncbi:hypothetical protein AN958_09293 [Leucoagaricus sp. SymC.cos]|nr:hypothetical protein AN958_09293 [Leucoagaricus sp. SymC.cos]